MATNKETQLSRILKVLFNVEVVEPTKLFDNVGYVGYKGVGSLVINTTDGLILIDTMWTYNDGRDVIVPGIKKLGWDPENIKHVLISHGHLDHYGSARYFEDNYDAKVFISKVDWNLMNDPNAEVLKDPFGNYSNNCPRPKEYIELTDRQQLILGDTTISVIYTPGHTPGGVSFIIPVKDNGVPHMAAVWGGTGLPASLADNEAFLKSLNYFESVTDDAGVDAEISLHPFVNKLLDKMGILQTRKPGEPNPIVIGKEEFKRYLDNKLRSAVTKKIAELSTQ